jgi:hypothetical protein
LQKQGRKLFVFAQEFFDVILHLNTGMDNRPKMSGSDKRTGGSATELSATDACAIGPCQ